MLPQPFQVRRRRIPAISLQKAGKSLCAHRYRYKRKTTGLSAGRPLVYEALFVGGACLCRRGTKQRAGTACRAISGASVCAEDAGRKPPEIPQRALAGGRIPFLPYSAASIPTGREKALPDVKRAVHSERRAAAPVGRCGFAEPHRAKNGRPYANKPRGAFFRRKRGTPLRYAPCRRRRAALRGYSAVPVWKPKSPHCAALPAIYLISFIQAGSLFFFAFYLATYGKHSLSAVQRKQECPSRYALGNGRGAAPSVLKSVK